MDPTTGTKDWLPDLDIGWSQTWPVELDAHRLVLTGVEDRSGVPVAYVFDRHGRQWSTISWPGLPNSADPISFVPHDGRLYVRVPASHSQPPPGGWPIGPDGEADDADAGGDTYHLWSVSLTDGSDVRDEGLSLGGLAFTKSSMVWTDRANGAAGRVHVRDLSTGEERSFDPDAGAKCNLLTFGATEDRIVMGEYCGTYADGERDDRVQVLRTDGSQLVTIQGSDLEGGLSGHGGTGDVVSVTAYGGASAGTYVYDLATDRFLRISQGFSRYARAFVGPDGLFTWATPQNHADGETEWVGQLLPQ
jgi:hypothetical protein